MKTTGEVLLAALALAAIYCAVPKNPSLTSAATIGAEQVVLVADGSDPMPLCRGRVCK
jgi:hypothetical protein